MRKNFNPTAVFRTGLITGQDGTVTVRFKLPDLLTRFRSTAVAVKDDTFGIAEGEILVQNPINVRTALPRRMRVGDAATAGVVLTNIDAKQHDVTVGISAQGVKVKGDQKRTVTLKPGDSAEVAFDLSAPSEGTAKLAFSVDSDVLRERLEDSLSVADPHLTESFTIVGKTGDQAKEALIVPSSFLGVPEEGLYLSLDSTIASALAGAIRFLDVYPYDCLEQVTSKLFARVLFPTLAGGGVPDLTTLQKFANSDGGFSYWADSAPRRSNYYVTLRVAHLLAAAKARGMKIPPEIDVDAMLTWLEKSWEDKGTYLQAYALYVLTTYGRNEKAWADSLAKKGDEIGVFGYGFLGLSYSAMGDTQVGAGRAHAAEELRPCRHAHRDARGHGERLAVVRRRSAGEGAPADAVRARAARFAARARARQRPACLQQDGLLGKHEQRGLGPPGLLGDRHARQRDQRRLHGQREAGHHGARAHQFPGILPQAVPEAGARGGPGERRRPGARAVGSLRARSFRSPSGSRGRARCTTRQSCAPRCSPRERTRGTRASASPRRSWTTRARPSRAPTSHSGRSTR